MCSSFRQVFGCKWVDEELSFVLTQSWIRWHSFGLECEPSILHPRHYRTCCSLLMTTVSSASSVPPSLWWYQGSGHWKWKKTHTSGSSWKMHGNAIIVIIDHLSVLDHCAWWSNSLAHRVGPPSGTEVNLLYVRQNYLCLANFWMQNIKCI